MHLIFYIYYAKTTEWLRLFSFFLFELVFELGEADRTAELTDRTVELTDRIAEVADKPAELTDRIAEVADKPAGVAGRIAGETDRTAEVAGRIAGEADRTVELTDRIAEVADKPAELTDSERKSSSESWPRPFLSYFLSKNMNERFNLPNPSLKFFGKPFRELFFLYNGEKGGGKK
ncbi:hypothetical protein [Lysinibacillus sphaericus]|uniref:Methyl-accepting chemotaxis protein n=1 Tax=Lysinibacillus sphaericus OT4b.31 TaxID=1285586 RepID=R7Z8S3_LYSSH|nr:hypothetical protein [Lysinibacillus sphaericus]EON70508.1 hypothetical protein H131_20727 [Lysinibacillus sphaericus OT4b.31]